MELPSRLAKLRQKLAEKEIDAIFISQPENRFYLSGFNGSAGYLLITPRDTVLATDFRYVEQAKIQAPDYRVFQVTGEMSKWFPALIDGLNLKRLGFEAENITFITYRKLSDILKAATHQLELVPLDGLVESLRAIKEPEEIELISRAVALGDRAFEHVTGSLLAGMTEKEIAWELEKFMRENGSQTVPFEIIVASGPNSALPHARPSERKINTGEPIIIDIGAMIEGYTSDLTRTICLGTPDKTYKKVYDTVLSAQFTAIALIKDGMGGQEADSFARTVIQEAGYGEAFGHSLGHGVGLAVHEQPRLGPNSTDQLSNGMVFTIEPGIYLPGWGGVRIEDLVVMENGAVKTLSKAHKQGQLNC